jgi:hypothetical protein
MVITSMNQHFRRARHVKYVYIILPYWDELCNLFHHFFHRSGSFFLRSILFITPLFGTTNPNAIPKTGDQILISNGWSGMVTHPNRKLVGIGGGAAAIGGLFILMYLLTMLRWKKNHE